MLIEDIELLVDSLQVDDMMKECLDCKLIGVEAYSLYNTHTKGREY